MAVASSDTIREAVQLLVAAAHPVRIILFGSAARGDMHSHSDLDLLVVLSTVSDRHAEMVRLQRALAPLRIPVDVLVCSQRDIEEWGHVRGTALYPALKEGVILYEAA